MQGYANLKRKNHFAVQLCFNTKEDNTEFSKNRSDHSQEIYFQEFETVNCDRPFPVVHPWLGETEEQMTLQTVGAPRHIHQVIKQWNSYLVM